MISNNNVETIYHLSPIQEGILVHSLIDNQNKKQAQGIYHQQLIWEISGKIDIVSFSEAWNKAIEHFHVLRTGFFFQNLKKSLQVVFKEIFIKVEQLDWTNLSKKDQETQLNLFLQKDRQNPFNLQTPPLMRLFLIKVLDQNYFFVWSHHHIILDGWSIASLLYFVMDVYEKIKNQVFISVDQPLHFGQYIQWLENQDLNEAKLFWQEELKNYRTPISLQNMPFLQLQPSYLEKEIIFPKKKLENLQKWGHRESLTLATLLQAAFALILSSFTNQTDIIFGVTTSGRALNFPHIDEMIGLFINTLPLRVHVHKASLIKDFLIKLQAVQHKLKNYEYVPLIKIQEWSEAPKGQALFEAIFVFENYPSSNMSIPNLKITPRAPIEITNYPLTLSAGILPSGQLSLKISYDATLYSSAIISSLLESIKTVLEYLPKSSKQTISNFPFLGKEQIKTLHNFQGKTNPLTSEKTLSNCFENCTNQNPDKIAIIDQNTSFTYEEVNKKANQLAQYLLHLGIKKEDLIAISLPRTYELLVAILALWKIGAVYMPLDEKLPTTRLSFLIEKYTPHLIITDKKKEFQDFLKNTPKIFNLEKESKIISSYPTSNILKNLNKNQLAYILFTSGSTGVPKAVMVEHESIMNIASSWSYEYKLKQFPLRLLQIANFTFDVFIGDLARSFFNNGTIIICPNELRLELPALYKLMIKEKVTIFESTPALVVPLFDYIFQNKLPLPDLKVLIMGSDCLRSKDYQKIKERFNSFRIINSYGITEATIDTSYYENKANSEIYLPSIPIGKPFYNMGFYILNKEMQLLPPGVKGEIYIYGKGVCRGYYQDPSLTAQKFLPNPFKKGERMYQTGDYGRWLDDGNLEFLGREDEQIKIRGYRIDLLEISKNIESFPNILKALVVLEDQKNLISYFQATQGICKKTLKAFLEKKIPSYMVPSFFVQIDNFPLSPNGKIDRKSLPRFKAPIDNIKKIKKLTAEEKILKNIWEELLFTKDIDTKTSFFDLGGNSLLILQLFNKINERFENKVTVADLFTFHTIESQACFLTKDLKKTISLEKIMEDLEFGRISPSEAQEKLESMHL